ncbi:hypothetical protein CTEN210_13228 [Chaetoceros tenuissimus]|uniref:Uncharacterized protein n=1 Tax=Chaetoceros tenuissimus TaxID=426638 RepID=A0AAD3D396_9STRA|nr:hypothetical protein CTEN210_13228 [Chaetoceros tenuissimus]
MRESEEIKIIERPISQYKNNTSHVDTSSSSSSDQKQKPATSTQKHIRPKLRKRNENVESLIEQTRLQISSLSTQEDRLSALKESLIDQPSNIVKPKQGPKGILKPSKYTKPAAIQSYENDTLADELGLPRNDMEPQRTEALPSVAAFVKDTVLEKKIEIPKPVVTKPQMKQVEKEQGPKIIKSLAELIELGQQANAHLENSETEENGEKMETMIEANMEFKCISENEYEAAIEKAKEAGISVEEYVAQQENNSQEEDDEKMSMNTEEEMDEEERVTIETEDDIFQQDDYMDEEEEEEEGDMFEFFGEEQQEEEEEVLFEPELRAFMILWNALKAWITADAVDVLKKCKSESFAFKDDSEGYRITKQDPFGKSKKEQPCDVHLSRCAGLMNMLKLNLTKCLDDCGYSADDGYTIKTAESRLYEFVQFFDYSEPMVKFHSDMWKALTVILLNIVLPRHDLAFEGKSGIIVQDHAELTLPLMLREVGITMEEYKYLVNSAIPSLDLGS